MLLGLSKLCHFPGIEALQRYQDTESRNERGHMPLEKGFSSQLRQTLSYTQMDKIAGSKTEGHLLTRQAPKAAITIGAIFYLHTM